MTWVTLLAFQGVFRIETPAQSYGDVPVAPTANRRILCVEDDVQIRELIVEELEDAGFVVQEAGNGQEGLDAMCAAAPDLVLCDITMPVMTGLEMLATIRRGHPELDDIPFIFLTAMSDRAARLAGLDLGADRYLTKPVDFDVMLAEIRATFNQVDRLRNKEAIGYIDTVRTLIGLVDGDGDTPDNS